MNQMDWQAYLDGSLPADLRVEADRLLREDPSARRELEGLRGFIASTRRAVVAEPVPTANLRRALRKASHPCWVPAVRWSFAGALAVAAIAAVWSAALFDPIRLDRTPVEATFATMSPVAASQWVGQQARIPAPVLRLPCGARFDQARHGREWAALAFRHEGEAFELLMSRCSKPFDGAKVMTRDGREFYVGKGIGWKQGRVAYYLRGGSAEQRWRIAFECIGCIETIGPARPPIVLAAR
ncbi:MAG: hypothetical protein KIS66_18090 [Fimbriimonadaceae bacterium]|nr:hypothetical protein [Fimbriimonadaceae bacterium]